MTAEPTPWLARIGIAFCLLPAVLLAGAIIYYGTLRLWGLVA